MEVDTGAALSIIFGENQEGSIPRREVTTIKIGAENIHQWANAGNGHTQCMGPVWRSAKKLVLVANLLMVHVCSVGIG